MKNKEAICGTRGLLRFVSYLPAILLAMPVVFLITRAQNISKELFKHVTLHMLGEALSSTLVLLLGVVAICLFLGGVTAWLLSKFEFCGSRFWRWAILMPLSLPAYVMSFIWLGWFDFSGLVPTFFRESFVSLWLSSALLGFRSVWCAIIPLSFALFPYMYLLMFEGFENQSRNLMDAARSLGLSVTRCFFKLELPMLAPWIFSGMMLVGMEVLADFGSASVFNLPVFTTLVYRSWFGLQSIETASLFSLFHILFLILFVSLLWKLSTRRKYADPFAGRLKIPRKALSPKRALLANVYLTILWAFSFVLPVLQLIYWAASGGVAGFDSRLFERIVNSFQISAAAAFLALVFSVVLVLAKRFLKSKDILITEKVATLGYGIPGTVIAVGWMASITSLLGSLNSFSWLAIAALVLGLATRFFALSYRPVAAAALKISPSLEEASQIAGVGIWRTVFKIHYPLLKSSFVVGFLFVFIDTLKEMPMTLLMRPFGWDTLAVRVYQYTSDGLWVEASLPALLIVIASSIPIFFMRSKVR